jgi:hypothetical protein
MEPLRHKDTKETGESIQQSSFLVPWGLRGNLLQWVPNHGTAKTQRHKGNQTIDPLSPFVLVS